MPGYGLAQAPAQRWQARLSRRIRPLSVRHAGEATAA